MMPPFVVFPTNRIAHFVEVSLYLFYLAQQVNLTIGKLYEAIVSEPCMKDCLEDCLREIIVTQDDLMKYDVFTDIAVLGGKNKYRKKSY